MNTVDAAEIKQFSKDSYAWWDEDGAFAPLHRLNPVRLAYLKRQICAHFDRDRDAVDSYKGLSILDIGCGGGLVCEPLTRLGGQVSGIDADARAIEIATDHAAQSGLKISYKAQDTSTQLKAKKRFDVVLALEIVEHVSDLAHFVKECTKLCNPGGLIVFSTLNRTAKSFALGIIAAEYILRWVPKGTHHWQKFVKPSELSRVIRHSGAIPQDVTGLVFDPFGGDFSLSEKDIDVNYFMTAVKERNKK